MKLKEVLDKTIAFFRDKKIETPRLDAELIFAHALNLERIQLYVKFDQPLQESELSLLRELVRRRSQGEPVAYILGYRDFYNYRFTVNSSTLIPRPETEHLVEAAIEWGQSRKSALNILDLGCGSGCVGLTLLKHLPEARLLAVDVSSGAIEMTRKNAESLGVIERVTFLNEDAGNFKLVMAALHESTGSDRLDILASNPPYIAENDPDVEINVKKFEPNSALFAEDHGLFFLKSWSNKYVEFLSPEAIVLMEMGMSQGLKMKEHFNSLNAFNEVRIIKDLAGHDRIICGVKNG